MKDDDCVRFLQWALPQLHMRWPGFRKVRKQVCKRIARRLNQLDLTDTDAYQSYLTTHAVEWQLLDGLCRVTVTRFYRDKQVFARLIEEILPALARRAQARHAGKLRIWCAGCGAGEEPYTFAIAWYLQLAAMFPGLEIDILATDADHQLLTYAAQACYPYSAVKNLPEQWRAQVFSVHGQGYCLKTDYRAGVDFALHDIRQPLQQGDFDLICCRNLAFTYFDETLQVQTAQRLYEKLLPKGILLLGVHEQLPMGAPAFTIISERQGLYRKDVRDTEQY